MAIATFSVNRIWSLVVCDVRNTKAHTYLLGYASHRTQIVQENSAGGVELVFLTVVHLRMVVLRWVTFAFVSVAFALRYSALTRLMRRASCVGLASVISLRRAHTFHAAVDSRSQVRWYSLKVPVAMCILVTQVWKYA